jgi:hypothetical protein
MLGRARHFAIRGRARLAQSGQDADNDGVL